MDLDAERRRYTERRLALLKATQAIWLALGVLETMIGLRILLRLIGANPASAFAGFLYAITDVFLWPFFGLTPSPAAGNLVLDIPAMIAMLVYALLAWLVVRVVWLIFDRPAPPPGPFQTPGV